MASQDAELRFVPHDKLRKFLRAERYVDDIPELRRAFQVSGVFVPTDNRHTLADALPGLLLGPATLDRLRQLVPRVRPLSVTGVALRGRPNGTTLSLQAFHETMAGYSSEELGGGDYLLAGRITGDPTTPNARIRGEITYDWSLLTKNPFEPEQTTFEYEARQNGSAIDVFVVSDRDRDLFKLSEALDQVGRETDSWDVIRVDSRMYASTESRHQILLDITQRLNQQRGFVPLGVVKYGGGRASDVDGPFTEEFDRQHRARQGEVTLPDLATVMAELKRRGSYMTMADILFYTEDQDREKTIVRIEVYLKLHHRRIDISLRDARELQFGQSYADVKSLDEYSKLLPRSIPNEVGMLRDLWIATTPDLFKEVGKARRGNADELPALKARVSRAASGRSEGTSGKNGGGVRKREAKTSVGRSGS